MGNEPARPGTLSGEKLCELTGLTDRRHRQLAAEGYFPPPSGGEYQATATLVGLFRYFRDQLHSKEDSLAGERKKYTKARREKTEEETAILRKQHIPQAEIAPLLRNISRNQRAILQNKLENELPPKLAGLDPISTRKLMAEVVDQLCAIFQNGTTQWTQAPPPSNS